MLSLVTSAFVFVWEFRVRFPWGSLMLNVFHEKVVQGTSYTLSSETKAKARIKLLGSGLFLLRLMDTSDL